MESVESNSRCSACKHLRRRCSEDCFLSLYFPATDPLRFSNVHKIFGAGNVTSLLKRIPVDQRMMAADTMSIEAYHRVEDPVYGFSKFITQLQQEITTAQCELAMVKARIAICRAQQAHMGHGHIHFGEASSSHVQEQEKDAYQFDLSPDLLEFYSSIGSV